MSKKNKDSKSIKKSDNMEVSNEIGVNDFTKPANLRDDDLQEESISNLLSNASKKNISRKLL